MGVNMVKTTSSQSLDDLLVVEVHGVRLSHGRTSEGGNSGEGGNKREVHLASGYESASGL